MGFQEIITDCSITSKNKDGPQTGSAGTVPIVKKKNYNTDSDKSEKETGIIFSFLMPAQLPFPKLPYQCLQAY